MFYIKLDVKDLVTGKEHERFLDSDDVKNGVIGGIGEKILCININST